jgi:uncharacterized membrane protein
MFTQAKVLFLLALFLPLAFLPFAARTGRVMLAWGLLFSLLSTRPAMHSIHAHYACYLLPVAFALAPAGLRRVADSARLAAAGIDGARLSRALLVAAVAAGALASWKLGGLLPNESFHAGYLPVARSLDEAQRARHAWLREEIARIPESARVGVTNRVGPHASNRMVAVLYPERDDVDWLVVDEAELRGAPLAKHRALVDGGAFALLARRDEIAVYRRTP